MCEENEKILEEDMILEENTEEEFPVKNRHRESPKQHKFRKSRKPEGIIGGGRYHKTRAHRDARRIPIGEEDNMTSNRSTHKQKHWFPS